MVSPATSSWNVLILCETTPLIFNRTKESLLFPIPLFSIVFFISIESISMLFCIYSPNSLYKYSVVKKKRPLNGTIFIISCNERIIASCSFNLTFNTSTLWLIDLYRSLNIAKIIVRHTNTYTTHAGNESKIDLISRSGCVNSCKACITPPSVAKPPNVFIPKLYKYNLFSILWFACF